MGNYIRGNIKYTPVVEQINRKFATKKTTCSGGAFGPVVKEANTWMGGATRTQYRAGLDVVSKNYLVFRQNARFSAVSTAERDARTLFAQVSAAVKDLYKDLSQISKIQTLWNQARVTLTKQINGVSAAGYGLKGWLFAVQYAGKKANPQYDLDVFPNAFDA